MSNNHNDNNRRRWLVLLAFIFIVYSGSRERKVFTSPFRPVFNVSAQFMTNFYVQVKSHYSPAVNGRVFCVCRKKSIPYFYCYSTNFRVVS